MCYKEKESKVMFAKIQRWIHKYKFWWLPNLVLKKRSDTILEEQSINNEYQPI